MKNITYDLSCQIVRVKVRSWPDEEIRFEGLQIRVSKVKRFTSYRWWHPAGASVVMGPAKKKCFLRWATTLISRHTLTFDAYALVLGIILQIWSTSCNIGLCDICCNTTWITHCMHKSKNPWIWGPIYNTPFGGIVMGFHMAFGPMQTHCSQNSCDIIIWT